MKKTIILSLVLFAGCLVGFAQEYLVYSVNGTVEFKTTNGVQSVKSGMKLTPNHMIAIANNARVVLLCEQNKELVTLTGPIRGKIEEFVAGQASKKQKVSDSYIAFIRNKVLGNDQNSSTYKQSAATSYRDDDSLIFKVQNYQDTLIPHQ